MEAAAGEGSLGGALGKSLQDDGAALALQNLVARTIAVNVRPHLALDAASSLAPASVKARLSVKALDGASSRALWCQRPA
jgi:hypothetical protein